MERELRKRPEGWNNKTWTLRNDKAPALTSLLVHEFLAKNETTVVPQLSDSPDLVTAEFSLFPRLKFNLKVLRIQMTEETAENSLRGLCAIPQNAFHSWKGVR
jgi:hypothetical protein